MSTFKDRLAFLWGDSPKPAQMARDLGMSAPGFNRIWYNDGLPSVETLIKIKEIKGCSLDWLLTGEGPVFADTPQAAAPVAPAVCDTLGNPVDLDEFVFIPRYDVKAAAGHGFPVDNEKPRFSMAFRLYWIKNYLHADPADLSVISVEGDSMEGVLNHRDTILINHAKNRAGNGLYVLRMDNDLIVKRTQVLPNRKLLILSANEAYAPFEIDLNDADLNIEIIGKVEWFGRSV